MITVIYVNAGAYAQQIGAGRTCDRDQVHKTLRGVVGVVNRTSSNPALLAASRISPVSSKGISGTRRPGNTSDECAVSICAVLMQLTGPLWTPVGMTTKPSRC